MKKILYTLIAVGVASFAIVSCNKSENDAPNQEPTIHLQVTAGLDTKTAIVDPGTGKAYGVQWTAGDKLGVFEVADGTIQNKQISDALDSDGTTKTFDFTLNAVSATEYGYTFVYPADALSKGGTSEAPIYRFSIADKQTFPANSFDKKADVLVSEHKTVSAQPSSLTLNFARIGATARMVLTGISSTEIIKMVSFSTTEGNIAGYMKFDPKTGVIDGAKDGVYSGQKTIELTPEATDLALYGDVVVWFRLYDITLTNDFTVYVKTDAAEYTKGVDLATAGKSLEFKNGSLTKFSVDLSTGTTRIDNTTGKTYDLVSSLSDLSEGATYLIVGRYATNTMSGARFDAMGVQNDKVRSSVTIISEADGVAKTDIPASIVVPSAKAVNPVEIGKVGGNYYIKDVYSSSPNDGQYLTATGSNQLVNSENTDDELSQWTITFSGSVPTIQNVSNNRVISPNLNSNRFAAYNGLQGSNTLLLYVDPDTVVPDTRTEVTLSFNPASPAAINLGDTFTEPTLTVDPVAAASAVVYSVTSTPADCAEIVASTGKLTIKAAGSITVKAEIPDGNTTYKPASASYSLTVVDPTVVDYVTLPWAYPEGNSSATSAGIQAIIGVTAEGLGSDYADGNAPYQIKLDGTGDYFQIKTDGAIGQVSVKYKMIGGGNTSTLTFSESSDGITFTEVQSLLISGAQNSTGVLTTTDAFDAGSRYVKIVFTKGSNVGIGGISISDAASASITWNLESIAITTPPNKTEYTAGESFNPAGMVVKGHFVDDADNTNTKDEEVTGYTISPDGALSVSDTQVTITYQGKSATQNITVNAAPAGNDGSLEHPYTVAEALAIIDGYSDKQKSASEVYVSGIIANVGSYNSTYHSVTYDISDDGNNANTLNIYSGHFVANTNFSSNDQISVNDEVIVYGYLYLYGTTKEMYQNNYIYSLNGKTKALTSGTLTATPNNDNKQITVTWGAATGTDSAISYVVTCGTQSYNATAAGSHTFTMTDYVEYTITVVASASDAVSATVSTTATLNDPNSTTTYSWQETALADITSSDVFVIVGNNGSDYAMTNDNGTGSAPAASAVTVSNGKITSTVGNSIKWNLSKDGNNYTFYPNGSTSTWLYCTATNNGVRVGTNANKVFTLESTSGYLVNSGTSRYIGVYNSQDWRCYTSINNNIKEQTFKFYVYKANN